MYGSKDFIQNGLKWNYGPYNENTPVVIKLDHAHTTNQIGGMTPDLVVGPAIICKGEVDGARFVFMTNPVPPDRQNNSSFHAYPVGTIGWAIVN